MASEATLRPYQERGLDVALDHGLARARRLPRRRHGSRQDDPAPRLPAAAARGRARATRARRCSSPRPRWSATGSARSSASRRQPDASSATTAPSARARPRTFPHEPGTLVLTTYGLLRRDAELLVERRLVGRRARRGAEHQERRLRHGQGRARARAPRTASRSPARRSRTASPSSGRSSSSPTPGLLGPLEAFRREFAVPIERYGNDGAAAAPAHAS